MLKNTDKGASIYSPLVLKFYDGWVLGVSNRYAWKCSTRKILLPFFKKNVGLRHLDVGVGTGFYLRNAQLPPEVNVTLMDLNPDSLAAAHQRLGRVSSHRIQHDVTTALKPQIEGGFDSISLFYLLHCLPGTMAEKSTVFTHLKHHLNPQGVLYGATILGDDANHNVFGQTLMSLYNGKGIFGNRHDNSAALEFEMQKHFIDVKVWVQGRVALFEGRQPIF